MKSKLFLLVLGVLLLPMVLFAEGIWDSAYNADLNGLKNYIEKIGVTVDSPDPKLGYTPLMYAIIGMAQVKEQSYNEHGDFDPTVCTNYINVINYLMTNGADVNKKGLDGTTPIFYSVAYGFYNISRRLIEHDAKIDIEFPKSSKIMGIDDFSSLYKHFYYNLYEKMPSNDNFNLLDYSLYIMTEISADGIRLLHLSAAATIKFLYNKNKTLTKPMDFIHPNTFTYAAIIGDFDKITNLVKQGQAPSSSDFIYAKSMGETNILEYLNKNFKQ